MHAAGILLILMLYIDGINVGMLILVVDFVDLVLEEFVIVAFLIIHDADDQQKSLYYDTLYGAEKCRGVIAVLQEDAAHT